MYPHSFATSSLLGFAGGERTLGAQQVAYVAGRRRLPALYNSPGSYAAGKGYAALSQAQVWDGLHPGISADPAALTSNSESTHGPKYTAMFSGTVIGTTGPIARLLVESSRTIPITVAEGRVTTPLSVTVVELPSAPESEEHPVARVNAPVILPVAVSAAAAAASGVIGDWTTFGLILAGMLLSGAASVCLQGGDLTFTRPVTTPGAPVGDGYLEAGNEIVVLKGSEGAVSSITRGRFTLRFKNDDSFRSLKTGSVLLSIQCFVQLLCVPFGTALGQFFFLLSMAISWLYNAYIASQEKDTWKRLVLEDLLKAPSMRRYSLGTRTTAAVFLMQVLKPADIEEQLTLLLPNNTPVWKVWRQTVARKLQSEKPSFAGAQSEYALTFSADEMKLLGTLLGDAQVAVDAYAKYSVSKY